MTAPARLPTLLTEAEAATALHVSPRTLRALRGDGKIRYVRISPRVVAYTTADIEEYIERQTKQDAPKCPSTNPRKAGSGTSISDSKVIGITALRDARRSGTPNGSRPSSGGRQR